MYIAFQDPGKKLLLVIKKNMWDSGKFSWIKINIYQIQQKKQTKN